jgi:hypothetical protein
VKLSDFFAEPPPSCTRFLKGTKPGDFAIEQAAKLRSIVNLKTAKMLGIDTSILLFCCAPTR